MRIYLLALVAVLLYPASANAAAAASSQYILVGDGLKKSDLPASIRADIVDQIGGAIIVDEKPAAASLPDGVSVLTPSRMTLSKAPTDKWVADCEGLAPANLSDTLACQWPQALHHYDRIYPNGISGKGLVVAVVDTGIITNHVDGVELVPGYNSTPDTAECGGGITTTPDPKPPAMSWTTYDQKYFGHGTHVASIIGSPLNDIGVQGVLPQVKIMPVKAFGPDGCLFSYDGTNEGEASNLTIAAGIEYAANNGADVINVSAGGNSDPGGVMGSAIAVAVSKGVIVVCASGNSYPGAGDVIVYPARYDGCLGVGATTSADTIEDYSQRGPGLDFTAPGSSLFASTVQFFGSTDCVINGQLACLSGGWGTSFAAPHVAGLAAAIMAKQQMPALTIGQRVARANAVKATLATTAVDKGAPGKDTVYGHGIVDPVAALGLLPYTNLLHPRSPQVSNLTPNSATLTWSAPLSVGDPITGYLLTYGTEYVHLPPSATSYDLNNLSPGTSYAYSLYSYSSVTATTSLIAASFTFTTLGDSITPTAPINIGQPTIVGNHVSGSILTCIVGIWSGAPDIIYSYSWLRDGLLIPGAGNQTYMLTNVDIGKAITCRVSATNSIGVNTAFSSNITPVPSIPTPLPEPNPGPVVDAPTIPVPSEPTPVSDPPTAFPPTKTKCENLSVKVVSGDTVNLPLSCSTAGYKITQRPHIGKLVGKRYYAPRLRQGRIQMAYVAANGRGSAVVSIIILPRKVAYRVSNSRGGSCNKLLFNNNTAWDRRLITVTVYANDKRIMARKLRFGQRALCIKQPGTRPLPLRVVVTAPAAPGLTKVSQRITIKS